MRKTGNKKITQKNVKKAAAAIAGMFLCIGAAWGTTSYLNRDNHGDKEDNLVVSMQEPSDEMTYIDDTNKTDDKVVDDQSVYLTGYQQENAERESEMIGDKAEKQKETLAEDQGLYAPDSIVLSDTTREKANRLADKLGAEVRTTDDGKFAVLYLPDGTTIDDVYNNDEYSQDISDMSPDYYVSVSDLNNDLESVSIALPTEANKSTKSAGTANKKKVRDARPDYKVNDPNFQKQRYLDYINLKNTWKTTRGKGVTVAIIDSGIDTDHSEFKGRISKLSYNASENKTVKDYGLSVIEDTNGHGTAVAGILAASMNNKNGIVGIAPEVQLLVIKCSVNKNGELVRGSDAVFGLAYAIGAGADIVNMSFGSYRDFFSKYTKLAVDSDVICVAAAGNESTNIPVYPAALDEVIAVGAYDPDDDMIADYSNYGENVDMLAPGTAYTTAMGGGYALYTGTSMSAPMVAGAAALYRASHGKTRFDKMRQLLEASSVDLGVAGQDYYNGFGELDVYALVCEPKGTIKYDMMTDSLKDQSQIFVKGHTLQAMPEPEIDYLSFEGWYFDPNGTDICPLYKNVFKQNITLYAKWGSEDEGKSFTYIKKSDGTAKIQKYTGKRRYVTVPSEIGGLTVTEIGESAFADNDRIRSVSLPSSIKQIMAKAFANCTFLEKIEIPDATTGIGEEAFRGCVRLINVNITNNSKLAKVGAKAFAYSSISTFNIPKGLRSIGSKAFWGNASLKKLTVAAENPTYKLVNSALYKIDGKTLLYYPAGLKGKYTVDKATTIITSNAFAYSRCSEIVLNDGIVTLGKECFTHSRIHRIAIPKSVTTIGSSLCMYCSNLSEMVFPKNGKFNTLPEKMFSHNYSLKKIVIPKYIKNIQTEAFSHANVSSVSFENESRLDEIGDSAFWGTMIKNITIPDSVESIGSQAFFECSGLESVKWGKKSRCLVIDSYAFAYTYKLKNFTIPNKVYALGSNVLYNSGITQIVIGAGISDVGSGVFASCSKLSKISVDPKNQSYASYDGVLYSKNKSLLIIYPAAKSGIYKMAKQTKRIAGYAFSGATNLKKIEMNSGLTEIGQSAFENCENLQTPVLPSTLQIIENNAFSWCTSMKDKLVIPKNVRSIGWYAFENDYALTDIRFAPYSKLSQISYGSFAYSGIKNFTVPRNVSTIGQEAFIGCKNLLTVTFESESKLERLPAWVFTGADNLRRITFEKGSKLKSIQARACDGLIRLEKIDLGGCSQLASIGNFAFYSCQSLGSIVVPGKLKEIGRYTFYGCSKMSKMVLPKTLSSIGRYAFSKTKSIKLYFKAEVLPSDLEDKWDDGVGAYYVAVDKLYENDKWVYALTYDKKAAIVKYKGNEKNIKIAKIDGYAVASIGSGVFKNNKTVTSITLPSTLNGIYKGAFAGTTNLDSISIPDSVTVIGSRAFYGSGIKSISFGNGSKLKNIGSGAFERTTQLTSIKLPSGITDIKERTFYCSGIKGVGLPKNLTKIGRLAFAGSKLETVGIPSVVTEIGYGAFKNATSLAKITFASSSTSLLIRDEVFYDTGLNTISIPGNITYIGNLCFAKCKNLTSIQVDSTNKKYASLDGVFYNKAYTKLITCPAGKTGSYTLSDKVIYLGAGAFEGSMLSELIIPEKSKMVSIGYRSFYDCDNLTHVVLPSGVQSIDYYAFAYCDNLEEVDIAADGQMSGIYEGAFYNCSKLSKITIPYKVQEISDYAFYGCSELKTLEFAENSKLRGVYDHAFEYSGLESFVMPADMIEIGDYAFRGAKLKTFTFNKKLKEIGDYALADSGLTETTELVIPCSVEHIGKYILRNIRSLESLTLPFLGDAENCSYGTAAITYTYGNKGINYQWGCELGKLQRISILSGDHLDSLAFKNMCMREIYLPKSMRTIGSDAFSGCSFMQKIYLPDGITSIGYSAFAWCDDLQSIHIPRSCTVLRENLFDMCSSLKTIVLHKNVSKIAESTFSRCYGLESITVEKGSKYLKTVGGVLYNYGMTRIVMAPKGIRGKVTIPDGVRTIGDSAFSRCKYIEEIVMPDTVLTVGADAFKDCELMKNVTLSKKLKTIEDQAFSATAITAITLPNSVNYLGIGAFENCNKLKSIKLSDNIDTINPWTFSGTDRLRDIKFGKSLKYLDNNAFYGCGIESLALPESLVYVGAETFSLCSKMKEIYIGKNVSKIGSGAFSYCKSLQKIEVNKDNKYFHSENGILYNKKLTRILYIPYNLSGKIVIASGIKSIDSGFFAGRDNITEVVLPDSVETIGKDAFAECPNLTSIKLGRNIKSIGENFAGGSAYANNMSNYVDGILYIGQYAVGENTDLLPDSKSVLRIKNGTVLVADMVAAYLNIKKLILPDSVRYIGRMSFGHCHNLKYVRWSKNLKLVDMDAFVEDPIMSVIIPDYCVYRGDINNVEYCRFGNQKSYNILNDTAYDSMVTFVGGYECNLGSTTNTKNIILENQYQIKKTYLESDVKGINIFCREKAGTKALDKFKKNNKVYYSGEWNLCTFYADGIVVKMIPLRKSKIVQAPAKSVVLDILPDGAVFTGWDINGDGKADELPATLTSDLKANALYTIPIKSISMKSELTLEVDETKKLSVSAKPAGYTQSNKLTWVSSDSNVVTVTDGRITGISEGQATIKAVLTSNKMIYASCTVTVTPKTYGIRLSNTDTTLNVGDTYAINHKLVLMEGDTDPTIFTSENVDIASVDSSGVITAVGPGKTNIEITHGEYKVMFAVTVKQPMTGVKIDTTELEIPIYESAFLTATFEPANTTDNKTIEWYSEDTDIAEVYPGGEVEAKSVGTVEIYGIVGKFRISCQVTVTSPIEDIALNTATGTLRIDRTKQLDVIYIPSDTTDDKNVLWSSDDPEIASVSESGLVTGHKKGQTVITGTVGSHKATYTVDVIGIKDEETGIIVANSDDTDMPDDMSFTAKELDYEEIVNLYGNSLEKYKVDENGRVYSLCVYDLTLKKGEDTVQPDKQVDVDIPVPDGAPTEDMEIYRLEDDGSVTDMNPSSACGKYSFSTEHFSRYLLAIPAPKIQLDQNVTITGIETKIYDGKLQVQKPVVVTGDGKTLKENRDYTVTYKNNKNIGTATVVISGKNAYGGAIKKTFAIKTAVGKVYTGTYKYKITNANTNGTGTVSIIGSAYAKTNKKFTTLKVADTVTIGGVKFKITRIETKAFMGYQYLKNVAIGSNVTSIGDYAFYKCPSLETVTVGKNVKTIGTKVFYGCKNFKAMKILSSTLTKVGASTFAGIKANATFALPKKYYNSYSKMIKKAGAPKKAVYKKF